MAKGKHTHMHVHKHTHMHTHKKNAAFRVLSVLALNVLEQYSQLPAPANPTSAL